MAIPGPFPEKPTKDNLFENRLLFDWLKPLYQNPLYSMSNFAVMYFTVGRSAYAGWNLDKSRYSGSVLKIAVLYAAYQLRENAKRAAPDKALPPRPFKVTSKRLLPREGAGPSS